MPNTTLQTPVRTWFARLFGRRRSAPQPQRVPSDAPAPPEARIPDLDGLRGIAILLVIVVHSTAALATLFQHGYPVSRVDGLFYFAMYVGWCGVDLFFVLSGFLITGILLKAKGHTGYYRNFYIRRALRIMPLYYAVLLARAFLSFSDVPRLALNADEGVAHALYVGNFWQCHARLNNIPFDACGLVPFWSLAIEEQFYLVWPLVVAVTSRRWLGRVCVAGVVAAVGCRWGLTATRVDYWFAYVLTPCRMDGLLIGALVALAATAGTPRAVFVRRAWAAAVVSLAAVVGVWVANKGPFCHGRAMTVYGFTCFSAFFAAVLCLVLAGQPAGWRVLRWRGLSLIGARSYAIYLVHVPAIVIAYNLFLTETARDFLRPVCEAVGSAGPLYACFLGAVVVQALAISQLTWIAIERPCMRLKRRFPMEHTTPAAGK